MACFPDGEAFPVCAACTVKTPSAVIVPIVLVTG